MYTCEHVCVCAPNPQTHVLVWAGSRPLAVRRGGQAVPFLSAAPLCQSGGFVQVAGGVWQRGQGQLHPRPLQSHTGTHAQKGLCLTESSAVAILKCEQRPRTFSLFCGLQFLSLVLGGVMMTSNTGATSSRSPVWKGRLQAPCGLGGESSAKPALTPGQQRLGDVAQAFPRPRCQAQVAEDVHHCQSCVPLLESG